MMTAITGALQNADGTVANGSACVSWVAFQVHGVTIVSGQKIVEIVDGNFSVELYPNITAFPRGSYYTVRMELDSGAVYEEFWIVPELPAVSVEQVRSSFPLEPGMAINPSQISGSGADPGMILAWNGSYWEGSYVKVDNVSPNWIRVATGSSGEDFNIVGSPVKLGQELIINIPDASVTARGLVTVVSQTFGGAKTFSGPLTANSVATIYGDLTTHGLITGPTITDIYSKIGQAVSGAVPITRRINTGAGLQGGGALSADLTLTADMLSFNTRIGAVTLTSADVTAVNGVLNTRAVNTGAGLKGGGDLTADRTLTADVTTVFGRIGDVVLTKAELTPLAVTSLNGRQGDVVLTTGDISGAGGVPATRQVLAGTGMGGGGSLAADVTLTANVLTVQGRTGNVVLTLADVGGVPATRVLTAGTGLTGGGDLTADRTFSVVDDTTVQKVRVAQAGTLAGARREINFIAGTNVTLASADNAGSNRVDLTINATPPGAEGAQTPWLVDVDAASHNLSNLTKLDFTDTTGTKIDLHGGNFKFDIQPAELRTVYGIVNCFASFGITSNGTDFTEKMRLTSGGHLLIGATSDSALTNPQGSLVVAGDIWIGNSGSTGSFRLDGYMDSLYCVKTPEMVNMFSVSSGGVLSAVQFNGSGAGLTAGSVPIAALVAGDYSGKVTSGTYTITITGNAAGSVNQWGYGGSGNWGTDFQNTPAHSRRWTEQLGGTGAPDGNWWFIENMRHSNASNYWGRQMAYGWEAAANQIWTRTFSNGAVSAGWEQLVRANGAVWNIAISGNAATVGGLAPAPQQGYPPASSLIINSSNSFAYMTNAAVSGYIDVPSIHYSRGVEDVGITWFLYQSGDPWVRRGNWSHLCNYIAPFWANIQSKPDVLYRGYASNFSMEAQFHARKYTAGSTATSECSLIAEGTYAESHHTAGILRVQAANGYADNLMINCASTVGSIFRLAANGDCYVWLAGVLRKLYLDGSGFVKA